MAAADDDITPDGVELYDYDDFKYQRNKMFDAARSTMLESFPMTHGNVRVELPEAEYVDPDEADIHQQKEAIMKNGYLARRLKGKVQLYDNSTNELLDEKDMTLMRVPYLTGRGTLIHGGADYTVLKQMRLLPGAYSRRQNNGELETQFNIRPKTGTPFRIRLEPDTAQYRMKVQGSNLHLYSLLHDIGVDAKQLGASWGEGLLASNAAKYDPRVLDKAYSKLVSRHDQTPDAPREVKAAAVKAALDKSMLHEGALRRTLPNMFDREKSASWQAQSIGKAAAARLLAKSALIEKEIPLTEDDSRLADQLNACKPLSAKEKIALFLKQPTKQASLVKPKAPITEAKMEDDGETYVPVGVGGILASTEKLLAINHGVTEPDDRDNYAFKRLHTPDKFLRDGIRLDASKLRRRMMYSVSRNRSLKSLNPFMFDNYAERLIVGNPLSMPLEEINPLHLAEQARRITQMGPGGIGDDSQITEEARAINPSQFGFVSVVDGPESGRAGVDARIAWGVKFGSDGKLYQRMFNRRKDKHQWVSPDDLYGAVMGLPD